MVFLKRRNPEHFESRRKRVLWRQNRKTRHVAQLKKMPQQRQSRPDMRERDQETSLRLKVKEKRDTSKKKASHENVVWLEIYSRE